MKALLLTLALAPTIALAQNPWRRPTDAIEVRYADSQPVISYTLRLSAADTTGFEMEMRVRNAPDTFQLAMAAHPEYDDRFWRCLSELRVDAGTATGSATRTDSSRWRIVAPGGDATIRWRVAVPDEGATRAGWRPFISPTGALVGGPHSFLYVIGAELAPASVALEIPAGWDVATGLTATTDRMRWFAPTAAVLVDSPILVGHFSSWSFIAGDVPHRIAWWPLPDATPFDSVAFVNAIAGVAREAIALFGRAPYRDFTYIVQDGAYGGLEHANSATFGVQSRTLAAGMAEDLAARPHPVGRASTQPDADAGRPVARTLVQRRDDDLLRRPPRAPRSCPGDGFHARAASRTPPHGLILERRRHERLTGARELRRVWWATGRAR